MSNYYTISIGSNLYEEIVDGHCKLRELLNACAVGKIPSDNADEQLEYAISILEKVQVIRDFEDNLRELNIIDYY